MTEEKLPKYLKRLGHVFDPGPFALDLYRLVCFVLADKPGAKLGPGYYHITRLKQGFVRPEVTRILISTAVALRIKFEELKDPRDLAGLKTAFCGKLYPRWPNTKNTPLTLREACNKIIHAEQIRFDVVIPDAKHNPDVEGAYPKHEFLHAKDQGWAFFAPLQ